jgi:hypothetical protein
MWVLVEEHGKYHILNLIVTQLEEFTMVWTLGLQNTMYTIQNLNLISCSSLRFHKLQQIKEQVKLVKLDLASVIDYMLDVDCTHNCSLPINKTM